MSKREGGALAGHSKGHKQGFEVDIRPLREDRARKGVRIDSDAYDREATADLIQLFQKVTPPRGYKAVVFFDDTKIKGTCSLAGHKNHFHVRLVAASYKCKS